MRIRNCGPVGVGRAADHVRMFGVVAAEYWPRWWMRVGGLTAADGA